MQEDAEQTEGAPGEESPGASRSDHARVSVMPERNSPRREALRALHIGGCAAGSKRYGLIPELLVDALAWWLNESFMTNSPSEVLCIC